jgi:hypothetical protein
MVAGSNNLIFGNALTERMRITSGGFIGINTTSPAARLTVIGATTVIGQTNVAARFSDDNNSTLLISHPGSTSATATITGNEQLGFATGAVGSIAERIRITSGGQLLVGDTSSPSTAFKIDSNGYINIRNGFGLVSRTSSTELWGLGDTDFNVLRSGVFGIATFTARDMFFATNNTERIRITSGGNVGIGTTSPGSKLTVYNTSGTTLSLQKSSGAGAIDFGSDTTTYALMESINGGGLAIYTGNGSIAERMRITSGGNLLVGTTSDSGNNFQVNGDAIIGTSSVTSQFRFYRATNVAGLEIQGGSGSGSVAGSAYLRIGDVTNSRYWIQQINNSYNYAYWFFDGGSWSNVSYLDKTTGVYVALSDKNKKKDFEVSTLGLNAVMGLKPTLYRMKTENETQKHLGFIAQEVKDFIPQAYKDDKGFIGLDYQPIVAALTKAVQELKQELDTLKNK